MASSSQQPIVFKPYDPFKPKTKHKTRAGTTTDTTSSCKLNASIITEHHRNSEVSPPGGELEQQQTCNQEPPLDLPHSTERLSSNLNQQRVRDDFPSTLREQLCIAVPEMLSFAADVHEREGTVNAADMRLVVEDSVETFPEPLLNEPDAVCSNAVRTESLQRRKRTQSWSADANGPVVRPPCSSPGWISGRAQSGKRRKLVKSAQGGAKLTSPSKSLAPFQGSDSPRLFPRDGDGQDDSDYGSSEFSDLESQSAYNIKRKLSRDTTTITFPRGNQWSTTENSEAEDSVNEDKGVDSEVGESSGPASTLSYHGCDGMLPAGPQQCRRASVEISHPPRQPRRKKDWSTTFKRKHLKPDMIRAKKTQTGTQISKNMGQQHRASPASAIVPCGLSRDNIAPQDLFEISGLALLTKPNSDPVVAHVRALNSQSFTTTSIPGLEACGAGFETVHRIQQTKESWILVGFWDRTAASISRTRKKRRSPSLEPESYISRDTSGLELSSAEESSEDNDDHAAGDVRSMSSRKPWKESDNYRLLSYRDKEGMAWDAIFKHFPNRSPGAVRTHYHSLLKLEDKRVA